MSDAAPEASGAAPGPSADPPAARSPPVEEADPSGAAKPAAVPVEAADINGSYGASSSAASAQLAVASPLLAGAADGAETPPAEQPQPLGLPEGASLLNKKSAYMDASTRERSGRKLKFADQIPERKPLVSTKYSENLHYAATRRGQDFVEVKPGGGCSCVVS